MSPNLGYVYSKYTEELATIYECHFASNSATLSVVCETLKQIKSQLHMLIFAEEVQIMYNHLTTLHAHVYNVHTVVEDPFYVGTLRPNIGPDSHGRINSGCTCKCGDEYWYNVQKTNPESKP